MARVSLLNLNRNVLAGTQKNLSRVADLQSQLASGKRIQIMSDDPVGGRRSLVSRIEKFEGQKHLDNIQKSIQFMDATDASMNEMIDLFASAKELAVEGANATQDASSRKALAQGVSAHLDRLVDLSNTVHDGRFIFAGTESLTKPFELNADGSDVTYSGNLDTYKVEVGFSAQVQINQSGFDLWKRETDIFEVLVDLRDALQDNDPEAVTGIIDRIDSASGHIVSLQGEQGGRAQRLELAQRQLEEAQINLGEIISSFEDVDMAETILDLQNAQVALEASLQTGARVVQPTLLDFL